MSQNVIKFWQLSAVIVIVDKEKSFLEIQPCCSLEQRDSLPGTTGTGYSKIVWLYPVCRICQLMRERSNWPIDRPALVLLLLAA